MRPSTARALAAVLAAALALLAAAGCGGSSGEGERAATAADPGPVHVHGLGVDPSGSALYIATHTGLYRMERGSAAARRVGTGRQDTMGFTIAGPGRFLGSGHPDPADDLPPLLGLIASADAGRTWRPVSLLGEADFHALRADGRRVTGYDAANGRLMRSDDGGRTWRESRPPQPLADLVVHPGDPGRLVAAGERGLLASADGGATWTPLGGSAALLAWPAADALYAIAPDGRVRLSRDGGGRWREVGALPGEPAALTAAGPRRLIVALHDGGIASSRDGGRTWAPGAWS